MYHFTDDCLIGVEQIDEEHRGLFQLIGKLKGLLADEYIDDKPDEICPLIECLEIHAKEHFRHEEEYMAKINHPDLELQRRQHAEFSEKISEMKVSAGRMDQKEFLANLLAYLVRWLYSHVVGADLLIGKMGMPDKWKKTSYDFKDEYLTGIGTIDAEHQELFHIMAQVHEIIADGLIAKKYDEVVKMLEELRIFTKAHFQDEEEYMESIQCEGLEAQRAAHEMFVARLDEIGWEKIDVCRENTIEEWIAFEAEWLASHILEMDKKIG